MNNKWTLGRPSGFLKLFVNLGYFIQMRISTLLIQNLL